MLCMWNKRLFVVLLSALFLSVLGLGAEEGKSYYALNRQNGLSSNCVLQMLQLRDGRMVWPLIRRCTRQCQPTMVLRTSSPTGRIGCG